MSASAQLRNQSEPVDHALLMAAFDACPASPAIVENGRILYAAEAFARTLGVPRREELHGRALSEILSEAVKAESSQSVSRKISEDIIASEFHANQRKFQIICLPGARSIDNRGQNQAAIWRSQKMEAIGHLLGGVAHDFNNVLTTVVLYSDLLIERLEKGSRLRRHAESIHKAGADGMRLIEQLLSLSRDEPVEIRPLSWNDLLRDMISLLDRLTGENISLQTRLSDASGHVPMDSGQAKQIILNLVLNAHNAMPGGGKIILSTRNCVVRLADSEEKIACVEFSVTDTGHGMDEKVLSQIFQPYFTTRREGGGSGLGLATVQGIVQQSRGEVLVRSEVGKGTRVTIRVPQVGSSRLSELSGGQGVSKNSEVLSTRSSRARNRIEPGKGGPL